MSRPPQWTQTYPSIPSMIPAARAFVRAMLTDSPHADDAELVVSEFATNSLQHTASATIQVDVQSKPGWARIAVTDQGTPADWHREDVRNEALAEHGRGLLLADALADRWGYEAGDSGQTMWAEFVWTES
ncbi:ATP-binding protein [Actinomadura barringtoniae]|uniref:ATP-binding protein n=1 Tax=Actinomadura barringtoniae TaxID=1427535 RepID=A0A939PD92_9ACTN|nr:ATP-binding protein [Actinomadura barringtoniae]MBO2450491.1 ATP-binding protein [Actinomadura barringtoniae]